MMWNRQMTVAAIAAGMCVLACAAPGSSQDDIDLPDLDRTGVVVPWDDFKLILDEIRRPRDTDPPPPPPVAFATSACRAIAVADRNEDRMLVSFSFDVQVLEGESWVEVPVVPEGAAVSSVTLDGAPARLYRGNGAYNLALRGPGRHRVNATVLTQIEESRGHRSATLRFPNTPAVTIEVELPRADLDVQVDGAVVHSVDSSGASTRATATLQQARRTTVTWFDRVESDEKSSKVFAEVATLLTLGEGVARGAASVGLTVHGKGVDHFKLRVPSDITVLDVQAQGITSWEVMPGDGGDGDAVLHVRLNFQAQGSFAFQMGFEKHLEGASASFLVPDIEVLDVLRERGFVAVAAATNVEINPEGALENAAPVDPSELPAGLASRSSSTVLYAFKYLRHPVVVPLTVVKHEDVAVKRTMVETAHLHSFLSPDGKLITSARYRVKNNRKQYLALALPEGAELWGAYRDGRPVKAARRNDGVILVPLKKTSVNASGELQSFTVEAVFFEDGSRLATFGTRSFEAPRLDVDVMELRWQLHVPRNKRYFAFSGSVDEDPGANRIAIIGSAAYNLGNRAEVDKLGVVQREGRTVVTDGANEVDLDEVVVGGAGLDRPMAKDELQSILGDSGVHPAPAESGELEQGAEEDKAEARRDESQVQQVWTQVPQSSNVQLGDLLVGGDAGGRARGVLPVHFKVPTEGLRLSFVGRLVTSDDSAGLVMRYVPAAWRMPALGAGWVVLFAFSSAVVLGLLLVGGVAGMTRNGWIGVIASAAALIVIFVLSSDHRLAFALSAAAAAGATFVVWYLKDRPGTTEGF